MCYKEQTNPIRIDSKVYLVRSNLVPRESRVMYHGCQWKHRNTVFSRGVTGQSDRVVQDMHFTLRLTLHFDVPPADSGTMRSTTPGNESPDESSRRLTMNRLYLLGHHGRLHFIQYCTGKRSSPS